MEQMSLSFLHSHKAQTTSSGVATSSRWPQERRQKLYVKKKGSETIGFVLPAKRSDLKHSNNATPRGKLQKISRPCFISWASYMRTFTINQKPVNVLNTSAIR